ncbi:hypothetical protein Q8A73_009207 [Channa argus]|nr:hypothetical protein Q8A73_009207 [Channa argus]
MARRLLVSPPLPPPPSHTPPPRTLSRLSPSEVIIFFIRSRFPLRISFGSLACTCAFVLLLGKSEQYALREDGRAFGVKLCSPAPVTVSDHVIISAALGLLRLGAVKGQFVSLFKLYMPAMVLQMVRELIKEGLWVFTYPIMDLVLSSLKQLMFGEAGHLCYVTIHLALEATDWVSGAHWRHHGHGKAVFSSDGSSVSPLLLSVISCFVSLKETFSALGFSRSMISLLESYDFFVLSSHPDPSAAFSAIANSSINLSV